MCEKAIRSDGNVKILLAPLVDCMGEIKNYVHLDKKVAGIYQATVTARTWPDHRSQLDLLAWTVHKASSDSVERRTRRRILDSPLSATVSAYRWGQHTCVGEAGYGNTEPEGTKLGALGLNSDMLALTLLGWYHWTAMFWPSTSAQCISSSARLASSSLQNSTIAVSLANETRVLTAARAPNGRNRL